MKKGRASLHGPKMINPLNYFMMTLAISRTLLL